MALYIEPCVAYLCMGPCDNPEWDSEMCSSAATQAAENDIADNPTKQQHPSLLLDSINRDNGKVNPYHVLQIRRDATDTEIRQSYRRLALWHHPGRTHESREERQRRLQVFEVLAACYETLMNSESRRRFDAHLKSLEKAKLTSGLPSGGMFVGGRRLFGKDSSDNDTISPIPRSWTDGFKNDDIIPGLSRSSTQSSSSSEERLSEEMMILSCSSPGGSTRSSNRSLLSPPPRSLVDVSSSGSGSADDVPEKHFTEMDTKRLFGGPLADLYRARNFERFTDSFTIFEDVFGSKLFHVSAEDIGRLPKWAPLRSTPSVGWEGTREISSDKTKCILKTSRVLHNRKLTRTETVTIDTNSGQKVSVVTVTSEDIPENFREEEDVPPEASCLMCFEVMHLSSEGGACKKRTGDEEMWCDLYVLYKNLMGEVGGTEYDVFHNLTDAFSCAYLYSVDTN